MITQRLDKLVADRTGVSRKDAKGLIKKGLVQINGALSTDSDYKVGVGDTVVVAGRTLAPLGPVYIMLNKPAGVLCATRDNHTRTVLDLLPEDLKQKGLFPAGRLDKDTEGFVLITDDGDLAHRILSPKNHLPKTYHAVLDRPVDEALLQSAFAQQLVLDGGDVTSPAKFRVLQDGENPCTELVIYEGMFHQVKRMFACFSIKVLYLRREAIGSLHLDKALEPGEARRLSPEELLLLQKEQQD